MEEKHKIKRIRKKKRKFIKDNLLIILSIILLLSISFYLSLQKNELPKTETANTIEIPETTATTTEAKANFDFSILSPENKTYYTSSITLMVVASDYADQIVNSFDDVSNITECISCKSFTRSNLLYTNGVHEITVYSIKDNQFIFKTVVFTIKI